MKDYIEIVELIGLDKISFETIFRLEVFAILLQLILICVLLILSLNDFKRIIGKVKKKAWVSLLIILILGLCLRLEYWHVHDNKSVGEKDFYLVTAKNIQLSFQENPCYEVLPMKLTPGCELEQDFPLPYSFFVFLFSFLFGSFEASGVFVSFLFGLLIVFLMFFLACFLFKNEVIALFAALLASLFPLFVEFSNIPNNYMFQVLLIELSMILILLSIELKAWRSWLLTSLVLILAAMTRFENMFLLIFFVFFIWIQKRDRKKILYSFLIAAMFCIPFFLYIIHPSTVNPIKMMGLEFLGLKDKVIGSALQPGNSNIPFIQVLLGNFYFTWRYAAHFSFWILGLIGFLYLFKNKRTLFYFLGIWFFTLFLFYGLINVLERTCNWERFMFGYTPWVIASAVGMFYLFEKGWYFFRKSRRVVFLLLILLVLININFLIHSPGKSGFNEKYNYLTLKEQVMGCGLEEKLKENLEYTADPGFFNVKIRLVKDLVKDLGQYFSHNLKLVKSYLFPEQRYILLSILRN